MQDVVAPRILEEATTKGITWQGIKTFGGLHEGELIADDLKCTTGRGDDIGEC